MTAWSAEDLGKIGNAQEFEISSLRPDGSLRPFVTVWGVRQGDDLYVRSAHGRDNPWFRRALVSGQGRIRAGGVERDVAFEEPGPEVADGITEVYHRKYDRYGPGPVGAVVTPEAIRSTLRLVPR
jgi:hypothetical protein